MLIFSGTYAIYSVVGYSLHSKYAAKFLLKNEHIEIKTSFWKSPTILEWNDIRHINLGNFCLEFDLMKAKKTIHYHCTAAQSIELKRLLKDEAGRRAISVSGG